MMSRKFNLTAKEILDQRFHVDMKGYSIKEVDMFLDKIIADYQEYDEFIDELGTHLKKYEEENIKLKREINALRKQCEEVNVDNSEYNNYDNLDIIKRISNLEKAVFKK